MRHSQKCGTKPFLFCHTVECTYLSSSTTELQLVVFQEIKYVVPLFCAAWFLGNACLDVNSGSTTSVVRKQ